MEIKLEHVTKKIKGVAVLQDVTKTFARQMGENRR